MSAFKVKDACAVMNSLARQVTGQTDLTAVDHNSFIDVGTTVLSAGTENVLNAIAKTVAYVIVASRPYKGSFSLINATDSVWNTRIGKISFYSEDNSQSGAFNLGTSSDDIINIATGNTDESGVGSQWEQKLPKVVEVFFLAESAWDKFYTTPLVQLQSAFNDEATFIKFMNGVVTEVGNDIESTLEARNRAIVADRIAGIIQKATAVSPTLTECAVDLVALYNEKFETSESKYDILTDNAKLTKLYELMATRFKIDSDRLTERTALYHDPKTISATGSTPAYNVLRHTPKDKQRFIYNSEFLAEAEARVLPAIFNPNYLDMKQGEGVTYWQSTKPGSRMSINCKPAGSESAITVKHVVGMLFDEDALMTINQFEGAYATPVNARHLYTNTFYHYKFGAVNDYTENSIVYYLGNGVEKTLTATGDGTVKTFAPQTGAVHEIISVTVGGSAVTTGFSIVNGAVVFTTAPADNASISIKYI